jgi:hypothetical protein
VSDTRDVQVAIDGPSASGKSTVARAVARELGFIYVDSGMFYRALTWAVLRRSRRGDETDAVIETMRLSRWDMRVEDGAVRLALDGQEAGPELRSPEVAEAVSVLRGEPADDALLDVTMAFASELLVLGDIARSEPEARGLLAKALAEGHAAERFARVVAALGGPADLIGRLGDRLPAAPCREPVLPSRPGRIARIDGRALGLAVVRLGGGRTRPGEPIDPAVGLADVAAPGEMVGDGRPLCLIHARDRASIEAVRGKIRAAFEISDGPAAASAPILERVEAPARP